MRNELTMTNTMAHYHALKDILSTTLEGCDNHRKTCNKYVSLNKGLNPVWLTRQQKVSNCCIVVPDFVSHGTLPAIGQHLDEDYRLVADLVVPIPWDDNTTISQAAHSIIDHNPYFQSGDALMLVMLSQKTDFSGTHFAQLHRQTLPLKFGCLDPIAHHISPQLWNIRDNRLTLGTPLQNSAACFIHLRTTRAGHAKSPTQQLLCHNTLITQYNTLTAFLSAVESRGGFTKKIRHSDQTPQ